MKLPAIDELIGWVRKSDQPEGPLIRYALFRSCVDALYCDAIPEDRLPNDVCEQLWQRWTGVENGRLSLWQAQRAVNILMELGHVVDARPQTVGAPEFWAIESLGYTSVDMDAVLRWLFFCIPELELIIERDELVAVRLDAERMEMLLIFAGRDGLPGSKVLLEGELFAMYAQRIAQWHESTLSVGSVDLDGRWRLCVENGRETDSVLGFETWRDREMFFRGLATGEELGSVMHVEFYEQVV